MWEQLSVRGTEKFYAIILLKLHICVVNEVILNITKGNKKCVVKQ